MVHARLLCSDGRCAAVYEAYGPLVEVEALACECGCGLELLGWPQQLDPRPGGRPALVLVGVEY